MTAAQLDKQLAVKQAFTNAETHPLIFSVILLKTFGIEVLGWEADTCWSEIQNTWGTTTSDISKQKIQAVRACYTSDRAYTDWPVFEKVAAGLSGVAPKVGTLQRPSVTRLIYALDTMAAVRAPTMGAEVYKYSAAVLMDHGMLYGPGALQPANQYIKDADRDLQRQLAYALSRGARPNPSGAAVFDIQYMKSLAVSEFSNAAQRSLVEQSAALFGA